MSRMFLKLWDDDCGFVITVEQMFLFVILILGLIAGWTNLRNAVVGELSEMANAILALNQGYSITIITGCPGNGASPSLATDSCTSVAFSVTVAAPCSVEIPRCP